MLLKSKAANHAFYSVPIEYAVRLLAVNKKQLEAVPNLRDAGWTSLAALPQNLKNIVCYFLCLNGWHACLTKCEKPNPSGGSLPCTVSCRACRVLWQTAELWNIPVHLSSSGFQRTSSRVQWLEVLAVVFLQLEFKKPCTDFHNSYSTTTCAPQTPEVSSNSFSSDATSLDATS